MAVIHRIVSGDLDGRAQVCLKPGVAGVPRPMGVSQFRYPAPVAIDDLLYLSTALSDNAAADALFDLVGLQEVGEAMGRLALSDVVVRHRVRALSETPAERLGPQDAKLGHALAIGAGTPGSGHLVPQLDVSRATSPPPGRSPTCSRNCGDLPGCVRWLPSASGASQGGCGPSPAGAGLRLGLGPVVLQDRDPAAVPRQCRRTYPRGVLGRATHRRLPARVVGARGCRHLRRPLGPYRRRRRIPRPTRSWRRNG